MIMCGVPRTGKTTFWKRLAQVKGFQPSDNSPSTAAFEAHTISANEKKAVLERTSPHLDAALLFDLHLYEDTSDLRKEALTIYKHILMKNEPKPLNEVPSQSKENETKPLSEVPPHRKENEIRPLSEIPPQGKATSESNPIETESTISISNSTVSISEKAQSSASLPSDTIIDHPNPNPSNVIVKQRDPSTVPISEKVQSPASLKSGAIVKQRDPIMEEINEYFEDLTTLLRSGEKLPDIPLIKKLCSLADVGGQRAFLEMLPTVTIGKALYLLFFSYENFEKELSETVQLKASPQEVCTGTRYKQMEVIMQSLICVSTTSKVSSENVALLVGTHVDKVETQDIDRVNAIIHDNVKPFLRESLVYAKENQLVLEVSIKPNKRCSGNPNEYQNNNPEDYQKVIMNLVENRLKCTDSEKLPASWYMFSIVLRRMQLAGHSVLQFHHCEQIAEKLYIKRMQLQALLSRMHKILGIIIYFPEVEQLKDIVICDPAVVYKSISELIFNSFSETSHPKLSLRLKKWGVFMVKELKERCKEQKGCPLQLDKLLIILEHLGIIAPVNIIKTAESDVASEDPVDPDNVECGTHPQYVIPCILNDAQQAELSVQIKEAQVCSIIPLRINFACGFAPMGGFCYLFTKLITNNRDKGWELLLPDIFDETSKNDIYWRNKVTFKVDKRYIVTLLSTHEYYEVHIIYSQPAQTFQLSREGHQICKKVWDAVSSVLSSSVNESLQQYATACECIIHQGKEDYDGHVMKFNQNPHEYKSPLTASCLKDKAVSVPMKVNATKQSVIVWFEEPHACQTNDLGEHVKLSTDLLFKVKSIDEKVKYEWWIDDERIREDDDRYSISDTGVLSIQEFQKHLEGDYICIFSSENEPMMLVSAQVQLNLTDPPEKYDHNMKTNKLLLFLYANGISYKVCKKLKDCNITANDFNLTSYDSWSQEAPLTLKEKSALKSLIAFCHCPPPTKLSVTHGLPTSAEISWKPFPEGEQSTFITGYSVQIVGAGSTREISVSDTRATFITVSKLRPSTSYTFNVSAVTTNGNGPIATITSTSPEEELTMCSPSTIPSTQCPVCMSILIDPCTLQCGHTTCQLCLAKMWGHKNTVCPLCKEPWQVLPSITIDLRNNIESVHGDEVALLRSQFSDEDKQTIKTFLQAKGQEKILNGRMVHEGTDQDSSSDLRDNSGSTYSGEVALLRSQCSDEDKESVQAKRTLRQEEPVQHQKVQEETDQDNSSELQIIEQPQSNTKIKYGEAVKLSVSATSGGAGNLTYLWKKNGKILYNNKHIIGTNTPTLTIREFFPDSQGSYTCQIKNYNSSIESEQADLALDFQVLEHPKSMRCDYHAPVSLSVSAIGPQALTYQWKRGGAVIDNKDCIGVNEATLTIKSFSLKHEGHYICEVGCNKKCIESEPAKLECSESQDEDIDDEKSMSAQTTDFVWELPGVEECGKTSVIVHSSQGQLIEWNGLKLHIHAGSLPEDLQECTIFIKASLAGEYEIPENTSLVSAIFWLRCEPQCTFIKPITVEIQHCSTKQDLSKLKIVRAFCSQKSLPYKFKRLNGGRFDPHTSYGIIEVTHFSGFGAVEEHPDSERLYYNQLIYYSNPSQQRHDIHIIYTWNTDAHINYVSTKYPEERGYSADCYQVVELEGTVIQVNLDKGKWTEVMDSQWKIYPVKPSLTKAELNDFKLGRAIPNCVLEARQLHEDFNQLLHEITLTGIKSPYNELTLRLYNSMPSNFSSRRDYPSGAGVQQPQSPPTVQTPVVVYSQPLIFSKDMSNEQLAQWLKSHPSLSGVDYEEDISKLLGAKISAHVFLDLNESVLTQITSLGFTLAIMRIIRDMKSSQQPPSSKRLPLQQQSPISSVGTPRTTQLQLSSSTTTGQQAKIVTQQSLSPQQQPAGVQHQLLSSATGHQPQFDQHSDPPDVPSATHNLMFSSSMSDEDFFKWLRSKGVSDKDCKTLSDSGISPSGFLLCDAEDFDGLTKFGKKQILKITMDVKGQHSDQQPLERDQSYVGSRGHTPQHSSQAEGRDQHTVTEPAPHPQALSSDQPKLDVPPQPLEFSKDMSYEQLAVWLSNNPQFVGANYQQDISKLKAGGVNGFVFLNLDESMLRQLGVSVGFQFILMDIIKCLNSQSTATSDATTMIQQQPSPHATVQQKQTRLDDLPTLDELLILKYTDKGTRHKVRIVDEASHKWKDIANLICGDVNVTIKLEDKCRGDPNECFKRTFIDYFINKKPQGYTQDWNGLIELLDDVNLQTLAEKVKHACTFVC